METIQMTYVQATFLRFIEDHAVVYTITLTEIMASCFYLCVGGGAFIYGEINYSVQM
jgi:hypothetical protein